MARKMETEAELRRRGVIHPKSRLLRGKVSRPWRLSFRLEGLLRGKERSQRHAYEGSCPASEADGAGQSGTPSDLDTGTAANRTGHAAGQGAVASYFTSSCSSGEELLQVGMATVEPEKTSWRA